VVVVVGGGVMVSLVAEGGRGAVVATGSPQAMGRVRGRNQTRFEGRRRLRRKVVAMEEGGRHRRGSRTFGLRPTQIN
jgi:hypothetical protein